MNMHKNPKKQSAGVNNSMMPPPGSNTQPVKSNDLSEDPAVNEEPSPGVASGIVKSVMSLSIEAITVNEALQVRVKVSDSLVTEYAQRMKAGGVFPPVLVVKCGEEFLLVDGFHRLAALRHNGETVVEAEVRPGDKNTALTLALSSNAMHGQRMTNADKKRAVLLALREWPTLSNVVIAGRCGVVHSFVASVRNSLASGSEQDSQPRIGNDGRLRRVPSSRASPSGYQSPILPPPLAASQAGPDPKHHVEPKAPRIIQEHELDYLLDFGRNHAGERVCLALRELRQELPFRVVLGFSLREAVESMYSRDWVHRS